MKSSKKIALTDLATFQLIFGIEPKFFDYKTNTLTIKLDKRRKIGIEPITDASQTTVLTVKLFLPF